MYRLALLASSLNLPATLSGAKRRLDSPENCGTTLDPMRQITLHTDGACCPNPGKGGWAVLFQGRNNYLELSGHCAERTTNNRMEVEAAIQGLRALEGKWSVHILTDSMYLIYALRRRTAKKRKNKTNDDLVQLLWAAVGAHEVSWDYVRGHNGDPWNERADYLAETACRSIVRADFP